MIQFIYSLKKEVDVKVEQIECSEVSVITKSLEASRVLADAFKQLKLFVLSHNFKNDDDEISFFKEIKPRLCFRLIYYRKVYNIEMNRPIGIDKQREYLCDILNYINIFVLFYLNIHQTVINWKKTLCLICFISFCII